MQVCSFCPRAYDYKGKCVSLVVISAAFAFVVDVVEDVGDERVELAVAFGLEAETCRAIRRDEPDGCTLHDVRVELAQVRLLGGNHVVEAVHVVEGDAFRTVFLDERDVSHVVLLCRVSGVHVMSILYHKDKGIAISS